jgi:enoyl-CoA hydratase/carnithine racemase
MLSVKDGAIGRITFNNPERRNAVSLEMWEAGEKMLRAFEADDDIRVIVFSGAGGRAFVSGADISKFAEERASEDAVANYNKTLARFHDALNSTSKPTLAMIQGFCIGGGVAVAIGCDLRICSDNSQFAIPAAKLGLGYGFDGVRRLVNLVGPAFTKEIFFTARRYNAGEAYAMGLVNRVVPEVDLEATVQEYTDAISANAPMTIGSIKLIVGEIIKDAAARDLDSCEKSVKACFDSADYIEGRSAFMEKRKPNFKNR